MLRTIAIIGSESTGKTTLCEALSKHYACPMIAEYARTYVENLQRPYTYVDVEKIAQHQVEELVKLQSENAQKYNFLFVDTDLIVTKVWFQHVYKSEPNWMPQAIENQEVDLYLLCKNDIPWQPDSVRENPDLRDFLYDWYKREIEKSGVAFAEIDGLEKCRLQNAVNAITEHFRTKSI